MHQESAPFKKFKQAMADAQLNYVGSGESYIESDLGCM